MKKNYLFVCLIFFSVLFSAAHAQTQFELEGVVVPRTIEFQGNKLLLNGFGIRTKLFMDVYVQALYLSKLTDNPEEIMESDTEMAIRIQVTSSLVTSKKLTKSLNKGMTNSVGEEELKKYQKQMDMLISLLGKEDTKNDDAFNLIYNSNDKSIWIYKNDRLEGKIPGFDFKKVFFGNWLSNKPVDEKLKQNLLGKFE